MATEDKSRKGSRWRSKANTEKTTYPKPLTKEQEEAFKKEGLEIAQRFVDNLNRNVMESDAEFDWENYRAPTEKAKPEPKPPENTGASSATTRKPSKIKYLSAGESIAKDGVTGGIFMFERPTRGGKR